MLRDSVRSFANEKIAPIARELDKEEMFSPDITRQMGELGLFGMVVSSEYGGHSMDYLSYIIAVEELARVDGSQAATVAAHNSLGAGPIYYYGNEDQKKTLLPPLCDGNSLGFRFNRA